MKLKQICEAELKYSILDVLGKQPKVVDNFSYTGKGTYLTSLEGGPEEVINDYNVSWNNITSLKYAPKKVGGFFNCSVNGLRTLKYCPTEVYGNFRCGNNHLTSFEGCPVIIGGFINASHNMFTSFKDVHKHIKKMNGYFLVVEGPPIKSHVLGLLLIDGLTQIKLDATWLADILNKYVGRPDKKKAMLQCQQELIELGHDKLAQL